MPSYPFVKLQFFTTNGHPLAAGKLFTYAAGTSTPLATYSDAALTVANTNPVILDAAGRAIVFMAAASYKFVLQNSGGAEQWSMDNIDDAGQLLTANLALSTGSSLVGFLQAGTGAVLRTSQAKLRDVVSFFDFMTTAQIADVQAGALTLDVTAAMNACIAAVKLRGGGRILLPNGKYKTTGSLDLTGTISATGKIIIQGESLHTTIIVPMFSSAAVFDLSGNHGIGLMDFAVIQDSSSYKPSENFLLSRLASNASSGDHRFTNIFCRTYNEDACLTLNGSEQNSFVNCSWFQLQDGIPCVAGFMFASCGYTPTSSFVALGTGEGGCGVNTFTANRFDNDNQAAGARAPTAGKALTKQHGAASWLFDNCFWHCNYERFHEYTNVGSAVPSVTFNTCQMENSFQNGAPLYSIYIPDNGGVFEVGCITIINSFTFRILAQSTVTVNGLIYLGGNHASFATLAAGDLKLSITTLKNAFIAPSVGEADLQWTVVNGSSCVFSGINAARIAVTTPVGVIHLRPDTGALAFAPSLYTAATGTIISRTGTSTAQVVMEWLNTSGHLVLGIAGSAALFTDGNAYATCLGSSSDTALNLASNGVVRAGIRSSTAGRRWYFNNLSSFADNATAIAGGLQVGDVYKTGADPDVLCIVH